MRIVQIDTARFGILSIDKPMDFTTGLNLWVSRNQAGKTTLLTFLEWMLYGPQSARGQRDPAALQRVTPWAGGQPMGRLVIHPELPDWPGEMLISARFNDYFIQLSEYRTQKTLAERVNISKSGEWDLGLQLLNLSRDTFRLSLQALQETLIEPLRGTSLRQMVSADLGKLVENPDVAAVDKVLAALETPVFKLGNGPVRTIREHKIEVTKELDILSLERTQLGQRLGEFRELINERDTVNSHLEQQERVVQGLERQAHNLELARNYYLINAGQPAETAPEEAADWEQEHPEYLQITPELEQEVDKLSTQLEVVEQELKHTQEELSQLESQYRIEEQRQQSPQDSAHLSSQHLREVAAIIEQSHNEFKESCKREDSLAEQIPAEVRARYAELEKLYDPHSQNLTAIMEWQKEHNVINEHMAELRERRADLQIMTRVKLPWTFYLGLVLIGPAVLMPAIAGFFGIFAAVPWIIMGVILIIAIALISPYWKLRSATGPAATELREVVKPAIDEGINQLSAQDRRRRRFIELYEIDRLTWDKLVDNIMEYTQLGMRMREYNAAQRDVEIRKSRRDTAWVAVSEIHPLAPLGVDMGWLKEQLEVVGGPAATRDTLATLRARLDENRKDVARLTAQRDQYAETLQKKLEPVGFAAQMKQGLRGALDGFRSVAARVRQQRMSAERQTIYEESTRGIAMDADEFSEQWKMLSDADRGRLSQLASTQTGYETACTRLKELAAAQREALNQRDKLRKVVDGVRDELAKHGQIDREAQRMKERTTEAQERQALLDRWEKALDVSRRIIDTLVTRAGQQAAPEISREMRKTLSRAPIEGVKNVDLGPNLEVLVEIEGAPSSIPPRELWTYLSTGAQKQVALALRLSMARTASGRTSLPLLLDEPLEELDDERAALVFDYIVQLAKTTQVVIMTCHARLYEWLLENHKEVHELGLPAKS